MWQTPGEADNFKIIYVQKYEKNTLAQGVLERAWIQIVLDVVQNVIRAKNSLPPASKKGSTRWLPLR